MGKVSKTVQNKERRSQMLKKVLSILLVVGLLIIFAVPLAAEVKIMHWQGDDPAGIEWLEIMIQRFEKIHPGVKIETECIPVGNMAQKVMIAIASDTTPDTLREYIGRCSSWWKHGALGSLNGTLSEEDLEDFYPSLLELCSMDGNLIGYPFPFGCRTFGVNMTLLEKAGVADLMPKGDNRELSLETCEQALEKVSELEGVYGTGFFASGCSGDYHMLGWFQSFGGYLYQNGDHTRTTLNSEAGVRALEWMIDLVDRGIATPGPAGTVDDHHVEAMWSGKIAFGGWVPNPTMAKNNYESGTIDYLPEYRFLEFPHAKGVAPPPVFMGPDVASVFKGCEDRELAIEWAQFMTSREGTQFWVDEFAPVIPSRKSVHVESEIMNILKRIIEKNGVGDLGLTSPYYLEVRNLQYPELQAAFAKMKTPKRALDDFADAVRKLWEK